MTGSLNVSAMLEPVVASADARVGGVVSRSRTVSVTGSRTGVFPAMPLTVIAAL